MLFGFSKQLDLQVIVLDASALISDDMSAMPTGSKSRRYGTSESDDT